MIIVPHPDYVMILVDLVHFKSSSAPIYTPHYTAQQCLISATLRDKNSLTEFKVKLSILKRKSRCKLYIMAEKIQIRPIGGAVTATLSVI